MNNLEENLKKIQVKELSHEDKEVLWHSIMTRRIEAERKNSLWSINIFNLHIKRIAVMALALFLVVSGTGIVTASHNSGPGDLLFPVELTVEKLEIKLAKIEKKEKLRLQFAVERIVEIKKVSEEKSTVTPIVSKDLSGASAVEIEAEAFTNETVVKIKADSKQYGYISNLKTEAELAKEISTEYSIPEARVSEILDFKIEDRESREADKKFLNEIQSINLSPQESEDVSKALTEVETTLEETTEDGNEKDREELAKSLKEVLILLGDEGKVEIRKDGSQIKIEDKSETEVEAKDGNSKDSLNNSGGQDNTEAENRRDGLNANPDAREDTSEIFCDGEWRSPEDCNNDGTSNTSLNSSVNAEENDSNADRETEDII